MAAPRSFASETDLTDYWRELGGTAGWQQKISGDDLTRVLSECRIKKANPATRQGEWLREVIIMEPEEIVGFISVILSRLPKLEKVPHLRLRRAPV